MVLGLNEPLRLFNTHIVFSMPKEAKCKGNAKCK